MTKGRGPNSKGRKRISTATPPQSKTNLPLNETSLSCAPEATILSYQTSNRTSPKAKTKSKRKSNNNNNNNNNNNRTSSDPSNSSNEPPNLKQNDNIQQADSSVPPSDLASSVKRDFDSNESTTTRKRVFIEKIDTETQPPPFSITDNHHPTPPMSGTVTPQPWAEDRSNTDERFPGYAIFSLWDYFRAELETSEYDPNFEVKRERVYNFFCVPKEFEKLMFFGNCVCLNSVLYNFTILPTRLFLASFSLFIYPFTKKSLNNNQKCDLLRGVLIFVSCVALSYLDLSRLYHSVRGQSAVKLYVIFNMIEIFDRLAASLGQDLLNAFFADVTLGYSQESASSIRFICQFIASVFYIPLHTAALFYQMMALNVSVNSYNDALLSLLMSNQFVEIKGSVFKKFERENLFQLTCSDITERFQLSLFLISIILRNLSTIMVSEGSLNENFSRAVLPTAFRRLVPSTVATGMDLLLSPAVLVLVCEILVDWVKHCFLTKFNHLRPSVYSRYLDLLCHDIVTESPTQVGSTPHQPSHTLIDQSPVVARRLGLSVFPLTCLIIRVALQLLDVRNINVIQIGSSIADWFMSVQYAIFDSEAKWAFSIPTWPLLTTNTLIYLVSSILVFICLIVVKLLLGVHLLRYASSRHLGMAERDAIDNIAAQIDAKENYRELNLIKHQLRASEAEDSYRPKNLDLHTVDRFALFKSRVP